MDSKVLAFELRDDKTLKKRPASLTFPRAKCERVSMVTNQRSNCHFLQEEQQSFHKVPAISQIPKEEKKSFQYGVSTKVFSVTDPTGTKWEVRLLLSPSEFSRLSSSCNLIGFLSTYLVCRESRRALQDLLHGKKRKKAAEKMWWAIAPFLCLPPEGDINRNFCTQLREIVNEACKDLHGKEAMMVAGVLAALLAAEMATSMAGPEICDYTGEENQSQEDQNDQIHEMVAAFGVGAEQLAISHQKKTVHAILRNPCAENWASGGRKSGERGETFEFGLCHKTFSLSEEHSEIQFLQSLQESYDMIAVFHMAAFAERLLMTTKWRKTLEDILKEGRKETINELSQLATKFVCSEKCNMEIFQKCFRKEMKEKWSKVKTLQGGGQVTSVFGVLVAITAALKAKSIVDNTIGDISFSSDEDAEQPVAPGDTESEATPDGKNVGLPNTHESGDLKPQTLGPYLEEATCNIGQTSRGEADGLGDENMESPASLEHADTETPSPYPADISHLCPTEKPLSDQLGLNVDHPVISSTIETSEPPGPPAGELQGLPNITEICMSEICKDDKDPDEVNATSPGSSAENVLSETSVGHVHDAQIGSGTTYHEDTSDTTLGRPTPTLESSDADTKMTNYPVGSSSMETFGLLEPPAGVLPAGELQGLPKITEICMLEICKDGKDPGEVKATSPGSSVEVALSEPSVGHVYGAETGSETTYDEDTIDTTLGRPTPTLESSDADTKTTTYPVGSSTMETSGPLEPRAGVLPAGELQGLPKITEICRSEIFKDDEDPDEVNATSPGSSVENVLSESSVRHVYGAETGSGTTYDVDTIDTTLTRPTPKLESSDADTKKTTYPVVDGSADEFLTFGSQNDPSNQLSHDQLGQRQDHPSDIDQGGEDTSNRRVDTSSFHVLLLIALVSLAIASFLLPSRLPTVLFTGLALILGFSLFLGRRP